MIKNILKKLHQKTSERVRKELINIKMTESDTAIDCGANVGNITEYLSQSGAIVYAFEPNPYAFEVLKKKFGDKPNVHCLPKGVLDRNDRMRLYLHEFSDRDEVYWSTGSSLLDFKGNILRNKFVDVEVIDLCEFIESLKRRIRILKLDVEGVECKILKKLINTRKVDDIDHIFVETHDHKISELKPETDEIRNMIKRKGIQNINLYWE